MKDWLILIIMAGLAIAIFAWTIDQIGIDEFLHILPYAAGAVIILIISIIASANRPKLGR